MPAPGGNTYARNNQGGRPSKYQETYAQLAYHYCLLGATDKELAHFFDVGVSTIYYWRRRYTGFSDAVKQGKMVADAKVARALFQRAIGYEHPETRFFVVSIGDYQQEIVKRETIKSYPPDVTALKFWLTNRQPQLWRDRPAVDLTGNGTRFIRRDELTGAIIIDIREEKAEYSMR
ncbi:terminase [Larkinella rosea]|uniref:Terminase n=1 Tax=Larkinella rosea TaxID=2025312 RepID=A0A3P1BZ94_9BACT|nr:terminase [Larkinella rosea]RRB06288.1 terminase [Larkinella rosea]